LKQICGSGPLCSILSSANRGSMNAPIHELPPLSKSKDLSSRSNDVREDLGAVVIGRDIIWDAFDMEIDSSMFCAGEFDNFVFDLPEVSISSLTSGQ